MIQIILKKLISGYRFMYVRNIFFWIIIFRFIDIVDEELNLNNEMATYVQDNLFTININEIAAEIYEESNRGKITQLLQNLNMRKDLLVKLNVLYKSKYGEDLADVLFRNKDEFKKFLGPKTQDTRIQDTRVKVTRMWDPGHHPDPGHRDLGHPGPRPRSPGPTTQVTRIQITRIQVTRIQDPCHQDLGHPDLGHPDPGHTDSGHTDPGPRLPGSRPPGSRSPGYRPLGSRPTGSRTLDIRIQDTRILSPGSPFRSPEKGELILPTDSFFFYSILPEVNGPRRVVGFQTSRNRFKFRSADNVRAHDILYYRMLAGNHLSNFGLCYSLNKCLATVRRVLKDHANGIEGLESAGILFADIIDYVSNIDFFFQNNKVHKFQYQILAAYNDASLNKTLAAQMSSWAERVIIFIE
ncbi:Protein CBG20029 [Caenorhabditis briggsae]|uniref:Protein CBG20029 n=1 Tax=Caenorhabditis briggsae TaxID=6238 RepID=A8XWY8_CAEBR|nr:Protein CBG20029 [Caenorhabditis briggsae]CAP37157.1 Protein CBG20029 [Caenorhabditis briggsae]